MKNYNEHDTLWLLLPSRVDIPSTTLDISALAGPFRSTTLYRVLYIFFNLRRENYFYIDPPAKSQADYEKGKKLIG